ncbi:hypothetical protein DFJ63DRAFT_252658 [Scheffersomyces coipomensis]|uniref:uncharacterized protein n=1 Tax=Scheffersomyces coipomensis TaxID=1788519 RepID=UPI00315CD248
MAIHDRVIRKESRIRGSGKRNIQNNNDFNIKPNKRRSSGRRSINNLQSALINPDNIENLPRLRSKSTRPTPTTKSISSSSTATKPSIPALDAIARPDLSYENVTPAHQIKSSVYDEIELPRNKNTTTNNNDDSDEQFGDGNFDYDDDYNNNINDDISSDITMTVDKEEEIIPPTPKSNRGRPKKVKVEHDPNKRSKGRPKKKVKENDNEFNVLPDEHPTRLSIPRSSKPLKLKEIPSDDDLEASLENDTVLYSAKVNLTNQTLRGSSKLKDLLSSHSKSKSKVKQERLESGNSLLDKVSKISKLVHQRDNELNNRKRQKSSSVVKPATTRALRPRVNVTTTAKPSIPIPLFKTKIKEKQKPLTIDVERLREVNNKDRRAKVNTLDVLKYLIRDFEPPTVNSTVIKESILQQDFKAHVLSQLQYLSDIYGTINDLTTRISQVQKQKHDFRKRIFELRHDHGELGKELNVVRVNYNRDKKSIDNLNFINDELSQLSKGGHELDEEINVDNLVNDNILEVNKIINPNSGIFHKLKLVNEKLSQLDNSLD